MVAGIELKREGTQIVNGMVALARPATDDHGGDGGLFQHPTRRDIGDGDLVAFGDGIERRKNSLKGTPTAYSGDKPAVFHLAPVGDVSGGGFRRAEPFCRQQAACQCAIGQ